MTNDDEGGEGVSIPPKNDDVIYEQPLSKRRYADLQELDAHKLS